MHNLIFLAVLPVIAYGAATYRRPSQKQEDPPCGVQAPGNEPIGVDGSDRIVGGIHAKPHSWPWAAYIISYIECGGTLINKRWMVTAGHCGDYIDEKTRIKLGADNRGNSSDLNEPSQQVMSVEKTIINPKFVLGDKTQWVLTHDVTLVKFTEDVQFNDNIIPICLPNSGEGLKAGDKAVTVGWGMTQENWLDSDVLMQVQVTVIDNKLCNDLYKRVPHYPKVDDTMVCAAGNLEQGGMDHCGGDSGGPVMAKRNGRWELFGVVSWAKGCAEPNYPGVNGYLPGPDMLDWILDTLKSEGS